MKNPFRNLKAQQELGRVALRFDERVRQVLHLLLKDGYPGGWISRVLGCGYEVVWCHLRCESHTCVDQGEVSDVCDVAVRLLVDIHNRPLCFECSLGDDRVWCRLTKKALIEALKELLRR